MSVVCNLGVILDENMTMSEHIARVCRNCYYQLRLVAVAIVGSRLDYCNSLLAGTSTSNLARLQMVQNTLARVVAQKSQYCHITPVLASLH